MQPFTKYEERGAYHWKWYISNHLNYRDKTGLVLSYFPNTGSVVDIGCGEGVMSWHMFLRGLSVEGIDTNIEAIQLAQVQIRNYMCLKRFRNTLKYKVSSIYDLPFEVYDYAVCHEVLEHLNDPQRAVIKIVNSARKTCIISTPVGSRAKKSKYDFQLFNFKEIRNLFKSYNTKIDIFYDTFFIKVIK